MGGEREGGRETVSESVCERGDGPGGRKREELLNILDLAICKASPTPLKPFHKCRYPF